MPCESRILCDRHTDTACNGIHVDRCSVVTG